MGKHVVPAQGAIGSTEGVGMSSAGARKRREAQALEIESRADIPGIGNDKTAGSMQISEDTALFGEGGHGTIRGDERRTVP